MTRKTKAQLQSEITANLADNTTREISAEDVRDVVTNITDSMIFPSSDETDVTITSDTSAKPVLTIHNNLPSPYHSKNRYRWRHLQVQCW